MIKNKNTLLSKNLLNNNMDCIVSKNKVHICEITDNEFILEGINPYILIIKFKNDAILSIDDLKHNFFNLKCIVIYEYNTQPLYMERLHNVLKSAPNLEEIYIIFNVEENDINDDFDLKYYNKKTYYESNDDEGFYYIHKNNEDDDNDNDNEDEDDDNDDVPELPSIEKTYKFVQIIYTNKNKQDYIFYQHKKKKYTPSIMSKIYNFEYDIITHKNELYKHFNIPVD